MFPSGDFNYSNNNKERRAEITGEENLGPEESWSGVCIDYCLSFNHCHTAIAYSETRKSKKEKQCNVIQYTIRYYCKK